MMHLEWRPYTAAGGTAPKTPPVRLWYSDEMAYVYIPEING